MRKGSIGSSTFVTTARASEMRWSLPDCTFDLDQGVPSVISFPEKTFLGRWGESDRSLDTKTIDDGSVCSSIDSSRSRMLQGESQPPQLPKRTFDGNPHSRVPWWKKTSDKKARASKVKKHLEASMQVGINIGSIMLQPLQFHREQGDEIAELEPFTLASTSTLSDVILARRRPVDDTKSLTGLDAGATDSTTAVFCIRRAGCGSCREHGIQLDHLVKERTCAR